MRTWRWTDRHPRPHCPASGPKATRSEQESRPQPHRAQGPPSGAHGHYCWPEHHPEAPSEAPPPSLGPFFLSVARTPKTPRAPTQHLPPHPRGKCHGWLASSWLTSSSLWAPCSQQGQPTARGWHLGQGTLYKPHTDAQKGSGHATGDEQLPDRMNAGPAAQGTTLGGTGQGDP